MSKKVNVNNNISFNKCPKCGSKDFVADPFNAEDWEGVGEAELAERKLGHHGTMICRNCGHTQEYDI
jgi:predicted nucleic-acid-binding Zn-ribbon protein